MKITILQSIAGHAEPMYGLPDFGFRPGETIDVDAALGAAWVKSGIAKKAGAKKPIGRGAVPAVRAGSVTAPAGSIDVETSIADGEESAENGKGAVPAVRAGSVTAPAGSIDVETSIADGEESAENGKDGE